jgi:hypothetical protein
MFFFIEFFLVSIRSDLPAFSGVSSFVRDEAFVAEDHPVVGFHQFDPTEELDLVMDGDEVAFSQALKDTSESQVKDYH